MSAQLSQGTDIAKSVTYTANSELLEVHRAPRRVIDPLELNWPAARDRIVVVGIVSGCRRGLALSLE